MALAQNKKNILGIKTLIQTIFKFSEDVKVLLTVYNITDLMGLESR
jgi:hypothetical protein